MEATGRMKDFYDIYYVATNFDFEGKELKEAIYETLTNRATQHEEDSVLVIKRLADNIQIQQRWNNFCKKILQYDLDLGQVISLIIDFMEPPFRAMIVEEAFVKNWSYKEREYY